MISDPPGKITFALETGEPEMSFCRLFELPGLSSSVLTKYFPQL